jgi:hypothetical protein
MCDFQHPYGGSQLSETPVSVGEKTQKKKKKKIPRPLLASMGTAPTEYTATFTGKNTQMHKYIFFKKVSVIKEETPDPCHWM